MWLFTQCVILLATYSGALLAFGLLWAFRWITHREWHLAQVLVPVGLLPWGWFMLFSTNTGRLCLFGLVFVFFQAIWEWWKCKCDSDDDDVRRKRKRLRSKIKSHIPRPRIVAVRPIQQGA